MKNTTLLLNTLIVATNATRVSTSYASSTWNPPKFGRRRSITTDQINLDLVETEIDSFNIDEIASSQQEEAVEELESMAPASVKAALIAVISATVISGARHAMEMVL